VGLLAWIITGLVAGALAKAATGGRAAAAGCLPTLFIGVVGGLLGGIIFNAAGQRGIDEFGLWSVFVAFVGATVLLVVVQSLGRR
jgi:uncharacterized membrane protein YeaQ/YmgE (transglycosylase-associated protein family)